MKVRKINNHNITGFSNNFNICTIGEVIVNYDDGGGDSEYISDLEVFINDNWIPMNKAFKDRLLITDNYNTEFFEPMNEEDKARGYTLY